MRPAFFTVVVNNSGLNSTAPSDGFIDPMPLAQHPVDDNNPLTSYEQSTAKRRANKRWAMLLGKLMMIANVYVDPKSVVADGGSAIAAASSLAFTLQVEAGVEAMQTADENVPGTFLNGAAAIKRAIARALVTPTTGLLDVYDPTEGDAPNNTTQAARRGVRMDRGEIGRLADSLTAAEAAITVTPI